MKANKRRIEVRVLTCLVVALLAGCSFPNLSAIFPSNTAPDTPNNPPDTPIVDQRLVNWTADALTLQWDPPSGTVASYDVYYREHGAASWQLLGQASATTTPGYTVQHSSLGNGEFDFAVTSVSSEGQSDYHTSLDSTAQPSTGWYVSWQL